MPWKLLADLVLAAHAAWVTFNVLGPLWCWKRPAWRAAHLATLGLTVLFMAFTGGCPLTDLENHLLARADPAAAYTGGFIARLMRKLVYWEVSPATLRAATGAWLALWLGIYAWMWRRELRAPTARR